MSQPRFHVSPAELAVNDIILINEEAIHAVARRVKVGQTVSLFDGAGGEAMALVEAMERRRIRLTVTERLKPTPLPLVELTIGLGLIRWERLRQVVEKATELGSTTIWPLTTEYAQRSALKKVERLDKVVLESLKQCGRSKGPNIASVAGLDDFLVATRSARYKLLLKVDGDNITDSIDQLILPASAAILAGPEGGLSLQEEKCAMEAGFKPVSLSSAILRTETAITGIVSIIHTFAQKSMDMESTGG